MKKYKWIFYWGILLTVPSVLLYWLHYKIYGDLDYILNNLLMQVAFVPIYVFMTSIIIDRILSRRERNTMRQKLNMVIGVFFSEVGNGTIKELRKFHIDDKIEAAKYKIDMQWEEINFKKCLTNVIHKEYMMESKASDIHVLKEYLISKRPCILNLMENSNLLEHESFSDMLLALMHLIDELSIRGNLEQLEEMDFKHLSVDIRRAYKALVIEWIKYMQHLKKDYPFLYLLQISLNPFQ